MARIQNSFFRSGDANRALDEYETAFGDAGGFYMRRAQARAPEQEAEYAGRIRRAIQLDTPMREAEILDMYGIVYEADIKY